MPTFGFIIWKAKKVGNIELNDIFGVEVNEHLVHQLLLHNLQINVKELNQLKHELKLAVAEENLGDKKELVKLDRVQQDLHNGKVVV